MIQESEIPDVPQDYSIRHVRLGQISFDNALELQLYAINTYRKTGEGLPVIFSLEHDPVVTCGKSTGEENLLLTENGYMDNGIELRWIDRGGDVTYHGPGQVVVYPIIPLRSFNLRAGEYIRILEESMIRTCSDYGVRAFRRGRYPGCWTDNGKIGAVGAAIKSGGITKHGLAFNVSTNTEHLKLIVPCGITDHPVVRLLDHIPDFMGNHTLFEIESRIVDHIGNLLRV